MTKPEVIYEDKDLIVINKPAGMPSQEDISGDLDIFNYTKAYLKEKYQKPGNVYLGLVHRLDRPVSGMIILAKRSKAAARLSEQIRERKIVKVYLAMIEGKPDKKNDKLVHIGRKNKKINKAEPCLSNHKDAKEMCLEYFQYKEIGTNTVLEVKLETGRFHQIRYQLSQTGHPIVGDKKYGAGPPYDGTIKLHAYKLSFLHPISKEKIELESLPEWL